MEGKWGQGWSPPETADTLPMTGGRAVSLACHPRAPWSLGTLACFALTAWLPGAGLQPVRASHSLAH